MCAIKNGDEIRCDFSSQLCLLVIYLLEKRSRFVSIRALLVLLLVVNRQDRHVECPRVALSAFLAAGNHVMTR